MQVEYEMSKGVLLRQDVTWRHNMNVSASATMIIVTFETMHAKHLGS